jgi:hypothetical protein
MRVVVGSGDFRDLRQTELDRHVAILAAFIDRVGSDGDEPRTLTMILRTAASCPARALVLKAKDLAAAGIAARLVLAKLEPDPELRQLYRSLSELSPNQPAKDLLRWARNPRLLDAHEQVTYGASMCWSGDVMRREADKRNALNLFEPQAPGTARLGHLAFGAFWSAATIVAERRLSGPATAKPCGAYEGATGRGVTAVSALRPSLQGWPLVRH